MAEIRWYSLNRRTEFPGDVQQCGECCALVHDANVTGHTDWHEHLDSRFNEGTPEPKPTDPAEWPPRLGDLWRDREGDLWFAVRDDDVDGSPLELVCSVSGGGSYSPELVAGQQGPLTLVHREPGAEVAGS